jgi:hypothetical protein
VQARKMRMAISPRLAAMTFLNFLFAVTILFSGIFHVFI